MQDGAETPASRAHRAVAPLQPVAVYRHLLVHRIPAGDLPRLTQRAECVVDDQPNVRLPLIHVHAQGAKFPGRGVQSPTGSHPADDFARLTYRAGEAVVVAIGGLVVLAVVPAGDGIASLPRGRRAHETEPPVRRSLRGVAAHAPADHLAGLAQRAGGIPARAHASVGARRRVRLAEPVAPPARDPARLVERAGVAAARGDGAEPSGGRIGLAGAVRSPADRLAGLAQGAGVEQARAHGAKGSGRGVQLPDIVLTPADDPAGHAQRAAMPGPHAHFEGAARGRLRRGVAGERQDDGDDDGGHDDGPARGSRRHLPSPCRCHAAMLGGAWGRCTTELARDIIPAVLD